MCLIYEILFFAGSLVYVIFTQLLLCNIYEYMISYEVCASCHENIFFCDTYEDIVVHVKFEACRRDGVRSGNALK